MKKYMTKILILIFIVAYTASHAQIEIDTEKKIGISNPPTTSHKIHLKNDDQPTSFYIDSDYSGTNNSFGIDLHLNSASSNNIYGYKASINQTGSAKIFGGHYDITPSGTGKTTGLYNYIRNSGDAIKQGVYNDIRQAAGSNQTIFGIYNIMRSNGTGFTYGTFNSILGAGTGIKYGNYNRVIQDPSSNKAIYGTYNMIYNNGIGNTYGSYNRININGDNSKYGMYSLITQLASSTKGTYGFFTDIRPGVGLGIGANILIRNGGDSERRGINIDLTQLSSSTKKSFGIYSVVKHNGTANFAYGNYNKVILQGSTNSITIGNNILIEPHSTYSNSIYGSKIDIEQDGTTGARYGNYIDVDGGDTRYGIYVDAHDDPNTPIPNVWAGYFKGNICIEDGAIVHASDLRKKENISSIENTLRKLMTLDPKNYNYKSKGGSKKSMGFIAQELEEIFPELVSNVKAPANLVKKTVKSTIDDPESDSPITQELSTFTEKQSEDFKAIDYQGLIPVLVKAIQEQQEQINTLQAELKSLKSNSQNK